MGEFVFIECGDFAVLTERIGKLPEKERMSVEAETGENISKSIRNNSIVSYY